eukprot:c11007_g1_i1.p1 GENE.c11007_g1_i1~~c11007_g1_i1.p1  ORF type:complete len:237 (+),score=66.27 c11007_g1_i1:607-1317(+)
MSGGDTSTSSNSHHNTPPGLDDVLVDNTDAFCSWLQQRRKNSTSSSVKCAVVLDNCGLEVVCDILFIDFLLRSNLVDSVLVQTKAAPVFVSDVMLKDFEQTLTFLSQNGAQELSDRVRQHIRENKIIVECQPFFTSPLAFWDAPSSLFDTYATLDFVCTKGDANYRRLLGDLHWAHNTPFDHVCGYFPCALLVLRTNKSGVIVGVPDDVARSRALSRFPGEAWLTNGVLGMVQFKP